MRGIEAALAVWEEVRAGQFAGEAIRKIGDTMAPGDRILASTLVYAALRRQFLWKEIYGRFLRASPAGISQLASDSMCIGTAGILELKKFAPRVLVNGLVDCLRKRGDKKGAALVNAVLRRVAEEGRLELRKIEESGSARDQALAAGIPQWVAACWRNTWGEDARALLKMPGIRPYSSFRVLPSEKIPEILERARLKGIRCWRSPLLPYSLRLSGTIFPRDFPGYAEGISTPQTESSMAVAVVLKGFWKGGRILEMCSGRGVKTGQIASIIPGASLECFEVSPGRLAAARREMERIGMGKKALFRGGDALTLFPGSAPLLISLDAPCSGSGTWTRHPEGKWKLTPERLASMAELQANLLKRAVSLLAPGGIVVYSTCSLMKDENEGVVARVLSGERGLVELAVPSGSLPFRRGRPWGSYLWPQLPWMDGFYMAAIMKKSGGKTIDE